MTRIRSLALTASLAIALTGCSTTPSATPHDSADPFAHAHGIVADTRGDVFIATHTGIFSLSRDGVLAGPIGGNDFDAMGLTITGDTLLASGHPGTSTPPQLGAPNLGVIRSDDHGKSWSPVALTGTTDFHSLTAGSDGTLYGIPSGATVLLRSSDDGRTWLEAPPIAAVGLAATRNGLYAATQEGLKLSTDQGQSFQLVKDAPLLYKIAVRADGTLVGIDTDGAIWTQETNGTWKRGASIQGAAQALGGGDDGRVVIVDDRGVVQVMPDGKTIRSSTAAG